MYVFIVIQMAEVVITAFLLIWFCVSVAAQLKPGWLQRVESLDLFALIPRWTFFAPNPGVHDYHLLYRDRLPDGTRTGWAEIETTEARHKLSWLWNPHKRDKKIISDVIITLSSLLNKYEGDFKLLMLSMPYLVLLHYVMQFPKQSAATHRQILIAQTEGFTTGEPPQPLFISHFHAFNKDRKVSHA